MTMALGPRLTDDDCVFLAPRLGVALQKECLNFRQGGWTDESSRRLGLNEDPDLFAIDADSDEGNVGMALNPFSGGCPAVANHSQVMSIGCRLTKNSLHGGRSPFINASPSPSPACHGGQLCGLSPHARRMRRSPAWDGAGSG